VALFVVVCLVIVVIVDGVIVCCEFCHCLFILLSFWFCLYCHCCLVFVVVGVTAVWHGGCCQGIV